MVVNYYFGFGFWVVDMLCVDWMFVYYYCVDEMGLGFDCICMGSGVFV